MVGNSEAIRGLHAELDRIATADCNVLITGETGTGKEMVASAVHTRSRRRGGPFVAINCAAIPDSLIESELFGYERGAFTGAARAYPGKLKLADGGSIFLDEVGEMSERAQAKLLRAIDTGVAWRVGAIQGVRFDARLIAATNRDLDTALATGDFRSDLYYRLNVVSLHLPPLRERIEDITLLLDTFVRELNRRFGREVQGFEPEVLQRCLEYGWPGNIRELRNFVETTFVLSPAQHFGLADLTPAWARRLRRAEGTCPLERARLLEALLAARGNKTRAASDLHCSRMTLYRRLRRHGLAGAPR
jgi:transcriptional regulator with PAS, ATPase and Fis domain